MFSFTPRPGGRMVLDLQRRFSYSLQKVFVRRRTEINTSGAH